VSALRIRCAPAAPNQRRGRHRRAVRRPGELLALARYVPSRFRVGTDTEEQYEQQNAGLLRSALLKRFESSAYAFRRTVEKMIASHDQFLSALDAGMVLTGDALRERSSSDVDDVDEFLGSYTGGTDNVRPADDYRVDELRAAVVADRDLLNRMYDSVQVLGLGQGSQACRAYRFPRLDRR
jgi:hypothetical protein